MEREEKKENNKKLSGSWVIKTLVFSIIALIQLIIVAVNSSSDINTDWSLLFIPVWLLLIFGLFYFFFKLYYASKGYKIVSDHVAMFFTCYVLTYAVLIVFFVLLTVQLNDYTFNGTALDATLLINVWVVFFCIIVVLLICYFIATCFICMDDESMEKKGITQVIEQKTLILETPKVTTKLEKDKL